MIQCTTCSDSTSSIFHKTKVVLMTELIYLKHSVKAAFEVQILLPYPDCCWTIISLWKRLHWGKKSSDVRTLPMNNSGLIGHIRGMVGWAMVVGAFGAEGRWFDSTYSHHVGTLGKSFRSYFTCKHSVVCQIVYETKILLLLFFLPKVDVIPQDFKKKLRITLFWDD